jgi:hypothetical protein
MKMNRLGIFCNLGSGLIQVAGLCVFILENRVKSGAKKLFLGLMRGQNRVHLGIEKAIYEEKRWDIANVHFIEYPQLKIKKANSLYVIREK